MDNRRKIEKISETKSYFFKKMKTHKTLARWTKKKREKIHIQKWKWGHYYQFYRNSI